MFVRCIELIIVFKTNVRSLIFEPKFNKNRKAFIIFVNIFTYGGEFCPYFIIKNAVRGVFYNYVSLTTHEY
jgi:hypothetical protein